MHAKPKQIAGPPREIFYVDTRQAAIQPTKEPEPEFDAIAHRRARQIAQRRQRTKIAAGIGIVAFAGMAALGFSGSARSTVFGPSSSREGVTWTHAELAQYIHKKSGKDYVFTPVSEGGAFGIDPSVMISSADRFREFQRGEDRPTISNSVQIWKEKSEQAAKDGSGAMPFNTFSWGRFYFKSDNIELLKELKKLF